MLSPSDIKVFRAARGWSQERLSQRTLIPRWRISLFERGVPPTPDEAKKLVKAFTSEKEVARG